MALGTNKARNWGREAQQIALALVMASKHVAYRVTTRNLPHLVATGRQHELWLTPSRGGLTLPFTETVATLVHVRRGLWRAESTRTGAVLGTGISITDVIRNTIEQVWQ